MIDSAQIKEKACGRYDEMVEHFVPELSGALQNPAKGIPCPCHGSKDGFNLGKRFNETGKGYCQLTGSKDIFSILEMFNGWSFKESLSQVGAYLGGTPSPLPTKERVETKTIDWKGTRETLESVWAATRQDNGTIFTYFKSRGLSIPVPPTLRLHPNYKYWETTNGGQLNSLGEFPAMIGKVVVRGPGSRIMGEVRSFSKKVLIEKMVGLHITYLEPDGSGKADVPIPRKIRSCSNSFSGAVIPLYEHDSWPGTPLLVGEGIETCLAAHELTGRPVYCAMTATGLQRVKLPGFIEKVQILGDKDVSGAGQKAAWNLRRALRLVGKRASVKFPTRKISYGLKSYDWNDFLVHRKRNKAQ